MEVRKVGALITVTMVLGLLIGHSSANFQDCYGKCFVFCMIEPAQTLCTCTTSCLKQCIFSEVIPQSLQEDTRNLNFCKLGCAFSICSNFSSKQKDYADKVDDCVGSCSSTCIKNYLSP